MSRVRDLRNGFLWADRDLVKAWGAGLGPYAIAVYVALCAFAGEDQRAWPAQKTLREVTGMSRSQVRRAIKVLVEAGWIEVTSRYTEQGDRDSNLYTLLPTPTRGSVSQDPPHKAEEEGWVLTGPTVGSGRNNGGFPQNQEVESLKNTLLSKESKGQAYVCPECGKVCKSKGGLTRHRRVKHEAPSTPEALRIYKEITGYWPVPGVREQIVETVTDCAFWQTVVNAYCGWGWNPRNAANMLEFYQRREIPGNGKRHTQLRRAGRGDPSEEESAASVYGRLWEERSRRNLEGS